MEEFKVYALDDDGNRIEPQQPEQEQNVEQEAAPEVEPQQIETEDVQEEVQQQDVEEQVESQAEDVQEEKVTEPEPEQDDNWFRQRLKERYEVEVASMEDLKNVLSNNEKQQLPEEVEKYLEYRKETGRTFQEFQELQKDWSTVDDSQVLREYLQQTKRHLDREDIEHIISESYSYDEDLDDDKDIRAKKIAYKEALYEARNYFEGMKDKFKVPLGSSEADVPEAYKEAVNFYNEYRAQSESNSATQKQNASFFTEKTNALFNDGFKGFEFNVDGTKRMFKPSDLEKVKQVQSNVQNFIGQHLDETGKLKDAAMYHKSLFAAMNPDAVFKYAYEQGKADATNDIVKETKNIDMSVRENTVTDTKGTKFRVVESGDKFEFKIKKRN